MRTIRRHLAAWAVAMLTVQIGAVTLTALRVCCDAGPDRAHAGTGSECPMHQPVAAEAPITGHEHHAAGVPADPVSPSAAQVQIRCDCASDAALMSGPLGLVSDPPVVRTSIDVITLVQPSRPPLIERLFSPPSPPPRAARSRVS